MDKILELRQKRAALVKQARDLINLADTEKRDLTQEENVQYERIMADVDATGNQITREERQLGLEANLAGTGDNPFKPNPQGGDEGNEQRKSKNPRETKEYRELFNRYVRSGEKSLGDKEFRDLQMGSDTSGGFVVAPQDFVAEIIKFVDNATVVRALARKFQIAKAESLGVPSLDNDLDDFDWTTELQTGKEDTGIKFGKREFRPHPLAKRIKLSNKLLNTATIDIEGLVRDRLGYKIGITQEKAFMTGSGTEQPLGLFTASPNGIDTSRDVVSGTAKGIVTDGLIDAKFTLKPQYWDKAQWIFHRDIVRMIRKLKDGDGNYVWNAGIKTGAPDTILDLPYKMSEYAPNTIAAGGYAGIIGDFSFYWVVDALDMNVQRLVELYAETNQIGFIGRLETDGMPVLAEAFVRIGFGS
jgi:HK97 family phage major capsid protein